MIFVVWRKCPVEFLFPAFMCVCVCVCVGVCVLHQHNSLQQSPFGLDDKPADANEMLHTVYVCLSVVWVCV